jgi:S-adenosylmethionine:diacylglycerol 3-amino-3-carboxypropyl transferase
MASTDTHAPSRQAARKRTLTGDREREADLATAEAELQTKWVGTLTAAEHEYERVQAELRARSAATEAALAADLQARYVQAQAEAEARVAAREAELMADVTARMARTKLGGTKRRALPDVALKTRKGALNTVWGNVKYLDAVANNAVIDMPDKYPAADRVAKARAQVIRHAEFACDLTDADVVTVKGGFRLSNAARDKVCARMREAILAVVKP